MKFQDSQYLQISGNIALMLPIICIEAVFYSRNYSSESLKATGFNPSITQLSGPSIPSGLSKYFLAT